MNDKKMLFACAAMQGILSSENQNYMSFQDDNFRADKIAQDSFDIAETMEAEYKKRYTTKLP